jgi:hypothetical protein
MTSGELIRYWRLGEHGGRDDKCLFLEQRLQGRGVRPLFVDRALRLAKATRVAVWRRRHTLQ